MKRLIALILVGVTLGCWGGSSACADELGLWSYQVGGAYNLAGPDYAWWYGCAPTSAGMMMGYYDRKGYGGLYYDNLVPGGAAEPTTFPATNVRDKLVKNVIASQGHVTDFYSGGTGVSGDDKPAPYHKFNSLADFMGTSQDAYGMANGWTSFWYDPNGTRLYVKNIYASGPTFYNSDGMYGMWEYMNYAGYGSGNAATDTNFFTQLISTGGLGFTFADYKAEIDAGRVVMLLVTGHAMFGYGYDDTGNTIYLNDTWSESVHSMTWGGSYEGRALLGVVGFTPTGGSPVPLPSTFLLMISGLAGLAGLKGRFRQK